MRQLIPAIVAGLALTAPARAETDYSKLIAEQGLAGAEATLAGLAEPTPSDDFVLGGVRFLRTAEIALQTRYRFNMGEMAEMSGLPFLRLPIAPNPDPEEFEPAMVAKVFADALVTLDGSLEALDRIGDDDAVAVVIDTGALWFDINGDGRREQGEGLFAVAGGDLNRALASDFTPPVVRFDTADAAWLSAYAHLLSGVSETVLALDPTSAITRVLDSAEQMDALGQATTRRSWMTADDAMWVDLITIFVRAIEGRPDVDRSRAAHAHFLAMIEDNQVFWSRVARETDNDREWIPNKDQDSVLPVRFPPDTGDVWRDVLAEAEALLRGDLLIPHWRLRADAGINLYEAMQNPPDIDIIGVFQGETILPYAEVGPRIRGEAMMRFEMLMGGDAMLYAVILN